MNIKYIILLFIGIGSLLVFWNHNQHFAVSLFDELDSGNLKKGTAIFAIPDDSIRKNKYSYELAYQISKKNIFQGQHIGFENIESDQFKRFSWLLDSASESTLLDLYRYNNLVVKAYVFQIFKNKNYKGIKQLFEVNIDNCNSFHTQSGCITSKTPFNYFAYKCIEDQLSDSEKKKYIAILSKYYNKEEWKRMGLFIF
jgi:hypothetical protein